MTIRSQDSLLTAPKMLWSEFSICNKLKPLGSFTLSYIRVHVCFKALSLTYVKHKKEQNFCIQLSAFIDDTTCSSYDCRRVDWYN